MFFILSLGTCGRYVRRRWSSTHRALVQQVAEDQRSLAAESPGVCVPDRRSRAHRPSLTHEKPTVPGKQRTLSYAVMADPPCPLLARPHPRPFPAVGWLDLPWGRGPCERSLGGRLVWAKNRGPSRRGVGQRLPAPCLAACLLRYKPSEALWGLLTPAQPYLHPAEKTDAPACP